MPVFCSCFFFQNYPFQSRKEANSVKQRIMIEQLFDLWDIDGSSYIEINEIEMVLSKWREDDLHEYMLKEG